MNAAVVTLRPALPEDAQALADLRVRAMRPSLESIGRFDASRARERLLATFDPRATRHITHGSVDVGFLVLNDSDDPWTLEHLYLLPEAQGHGVGSAVLGIVFAEADRRAKSIRVGALKDSPANGFYRRHGFELVEHGEWDNHYLRRPAGCGSAPNS